MAHQPVTSIAVQAARTVCVSGLTIELMPSARYATTAPIQPTELMTCTLRATLRTPGLIDRLMAIACRARHRERPACAFLRCQLDAARQRAEPGRRGRSRGPLPSAVYLAAIRARSRRRCGG